MRGVLVVQLIGLVLILSFLPVRAANAIQVKRLYNAEAVVTGAGEKERLRGFRSGLEDILIKLSGQARFVRSLDLEPHFSRAAVFVQGFDYEDRMKGIPVHDEQGTRERPHDLRMTFDPAKTDALMGRLGLSKWNGNRPMLAVWLGVKTAAGSYILGVCRDCGYGQKWVLKSHSARRGVPIVLPEPAGPGDAAVTFNDIADGRISKVKRHGAGAMIAGALTLSDTGYWDINWLFVRGAERQSWRLENVTFDAALKDGIDRSAEILSRQ